MFWQGGFTFYAAVVVPIGQQVLGSHLQQGFITRQVTDGLNLSGAIALVVFAWDILAATQEPQRRHLARWGLWLGMALALGILVWLHEYLDEMLDLEAETLRLALAKAFRRGHRWYLWVSTIQWAFSLAYAVLTLLAWRTQDGMACKGSFEQGEGGRIKTSCC
jgi:hypothetical protein